MALAFGMTPKDTRVSKLVGKMCVFMSISGNRLMGVSHLDMMFIISTSLKTTLLSRILSYSPALIIEEYMLAG
jgi:hypothetical protein